MITEASPDDVLRAALHMYAEASPDDGLRVWVSDLVGDLYDICRERDDTYTVARYTDAVNLGIGYASQ
jgi:hypothetical protein